MGSLAADLRFAARNLLKSPGFALVTILTLALGIGANAAMFSVVNGVVLRPLAYPRPDQLVRIVSQFPTMGFDTFWISPPEFFELQERSRSFQSIGAYTSSAANLSGRIRMDDLDTRRGPWLRGYRAYGRSKLMNVLHTRELARRLRGTPVSAFAFHPGLVNTNFGGHSTAWQLMTSQVGVAISSEAGAQPLVRLAAAAEVPAPSGNYFHRLKAPGPTLRQANDAGLAKALWSASEVRAGVR